MERLTREILDRVAAELKLPPGDPRVLQVAYRMLWEIATGKPADKVARDPHPLLPPEDDPSRRTPDREDLRELVDSILDDPFPRTSYLARPLNVPATTETTKIWMKDLLKDLHAGENAAACEESRAHWRTTVEPPEPSGTIDLAGFVREAQPLPPPPVAAEAPVSHPSMPRSPRRARFVSRLGRFSSERAADWERDHALTTDQAAKATPAWLIALAAHFVIAVILMNIVYFTRHTGSGTLFRISFSGAPPTLPTPEGDPNGTGIQDRGQGGTENEHTGSTGSPNPDVSDNGDPRLPAKGPDSTTQAPTVTVGVGGSGPGDGKSGQNGFGGPYAARGGDARKGALRRFGGDDETEAAVRAGLEWLARHQAPDGSWGTLEPAKICGENDRCGDVQAPFPTATTGLCLLAFMGAGYTHRDSDTADYRATVERATNWLLRRQQREGDFECDMAGVQVYTLGIVTFALAELYAMTGDATLKPAVERAVRAIVACQQDCGGWDYRLEKTRRGDTSITGWQVMALRSARAAGITVPREAWDKAKDFLAEKMTDRKKVQVAYDWKMGIAAPGSIAILASGTLAQNYLGAKDKEFERRVVLRLLGNTPRWTRDGVEEPWGQSLYSWYYSSLVVFHYGGDAWNAWNKELKKSIVPPQRKDGHQKGSWDPVPLDCAHGGRVYASAMSVLLLEIYYRYLPTYTTDLSAVEQAADPARMPQQDDTPEQLVALLGSDSMMARWGAARELCRRKEASAIPALVAAAKKETTSARSVMIEELAVFGTDERVLEALVGFLESEPRVREAAVRALGKATGETSREKAQEWADWWEERKKNR